jgi:DNA-directed RNA polymerase specialized sigma24 family protein
LQEIRIALWRSFANFDGRCSLRTWVYRVAHNTAADLTGLSSSNVATKVTASRKYSASAFMNERHVMVNEAFGDDVRALWQSQQGDGGHMSASEARSKSEDLQDKARRRP